MLAMSLPAPKRRRTAARTIRIDDNHRGIVLDAGDNAGRYLELMRVDKKAQAGEIRFVLIDGPGKAVLRNEAASVLMTNPLYTWRIRWSTSHGKACGQS